MLACLKKFVEGTESSCLKGGEGGLCSRMSYLLVCYYFFSGWEQKCSPKY